MKIFKLNLFIGILLFLLASACSKVEDEVIYYPPKGDESFSYFPMSVGSYWIYEQYKIEQGMEEQATGVYDSIYVAKDTFINTNQYYILRSGFSDSWKSILRDSSGYLVNEQGKRLFKDNATGEVLYKKLSLNNDSDTIYMEKLIMEEPTTMIKVPAGTYSVVNAAFYQYFPKALTTPKERMLDYMYAKNVGLVYRSYYDLDSGNKFSYQLLWYHNSIIHTQTK